MLKKIWKRMAINLALGVVFCGAVLPIKVQANTLSPEGARAYLEIVNGYTKQYGTGKADSSQNGLLQSRLLDMDGDGDFELQVLYVASGIPTLEFWHFTDSRAEKLYTGYLFEDNFMYGGSVIFSLYEGENKWLFYQQSNGGMLGSGWVDNRVFQYNGTVMTEILNYSVGYPYSEDFSHFRRIGTVNGVSIDENESVGHFQADWETEFLSNYHTGDILTIGICSGGSMPEDYFGYGNMPTTSCTSQLQVLASATPVVEENTSAPVEESPAVETTADTILPETQHNTRLTGSRWSQYLEILQDYTAQYGVSDGSSQGLASSHLLDLDGNGTEELVLTLCTQTSPVSLRTEVWEVMNGVATQTFVHAQNQKQETDWRDVGFLYQYNGGWIFYTAGGGGNDPYFSYDRIFSYQNNSFQVIDETNLIRYRMFGDTSEPWCYMGYVSGGSEYGYFGMDESSLKVATAIPDWYNGFKRIQNQYFSGSNIELFYMDKGSYSWGVSSVASSLEDSEKTAVVILPVEGSAENLARYQGYQQVILDIQNQYGTSTGVDEGYAFSYLRDFTGDGQVELLVGFHMHMAYFARDTGWPEFAMVGRNKFAYEIWKMEGNTPVKAYSAIPTDELGGVESESHWSLIEDGGVWKILYQESNPGGEFYTTIAYENGSFVENSVGQITSSTETSLISSRGGIGNLWWDTQTCDLDLQNKVLYHSGSDHYYGYPVVFDPEIRENLGTLALNGEILAVYQVEEGLYYVIVNVNGTQQSHLVSFEDEAWEILSSATENMSFQGIEEEKLLFLTVSDEEEEEDDEEEEGSSGRNSSEEKESIPILFLLIPMGIATLIVIVVFVVMNGKKKNKNTENKENTP